MSSLHPKEAGMGKRGFRGFRDHREREQNMGHLEGLGRSHRDTPGEGGNMAGSPPHPVYEDLRW